MIYKHEIAKILKCTERAKHPVGVLRRDPPGSPCKKYGVVSGGHESSAEAPVEAVTAVNAGSLQPPIMDELNGQQAVQEYLVDAHLQPLHRSSLCIWFPPESWSF